MRVTFDSAEEMLDTIINGFDLYNTKTEEYVFVYSESGSICVYNINNDEMKKLTKTARENGSHVGAYLGTGGNIYDDVSNPHYNVFKISNFSSTRLRIFLFSNKM